MRDLVVVGGGIVGLTAAYEAAGLGARVTIVDDGRAGRATDAGAGIVNVLDLVARRSPAERARIELAGAAGYDRLTARLAEDGIGEHGYARCGQLVVAPDAERAEELTALSRRLSESDSPTLKELIGAVEQVDSADAARLVPYLGHCAAGLLLSGIARVDGRVMSAALRGALERRNVRSIRGTAQVVENGRGAAVDVGGDRIDAGRVLLTTGAWAELPQLRGVIRPDRGQITHLSYDSPDGGAFPIVSAVNGPYILHFPPGRVVTGATHENAGFDRRVTAGGVHEVLGAALRIAPGLADATMLETRVGFRPVSTDGLPIVGAARGMPGLIIATGLGAHGLTLGPALGAVAARLALDRPTGPDVSAFSPDRFLR